VAYIQREWISEYAEGLLALSGGRHGDVGQALIGGRQQDAKTLLESWCKDFPNRFYLELQRTGRAEEEDYLHKVMDLAEQLQCPVVATNDVRFLKSSEFEAHEARVCIYEGRSLDDPRRERRYTEEQYLKSPAEMQELFSDIPEALQNTVEIAKRCSVELELGKAYLPDYPIPEGMTIEGFFEQVSFEGLERRLLKILDSNDPNYTEKKSLPQIGFSPTA